MQFSIQHRFYGPIDEKPFETFFGTQSGANVGLGLRCAIPLSVEIFTQYIYRNKEFLVGLGYHREFTHIGSIQANAHYFSFKSSFFADNRESGLFIDLDAKTHPLLQRVIPVLNIGYDTFLEKIGLGLGIDVILTEKIGFLCEVYSPLDAEMDEKATTVFGLKFKTYGHHFLFQVSNSYQLGTRRLMRGTTEDDFYLGFTIHRLLEL